MNKKEYAKVNKDWLVEKSKEEGVLYLDNGIYYKIISNGPADGIQPTVNDVILVHYTGWTIDGKEFESSRNDIPLACRLRDLVQGWIVALQKMHIGDIWEIYLPAEMGYGKCSQPGIPGGSTLIFEIELLGVQ